MARKDMATQNPGAVNGAADNAEAAQVESKDDQVRCRAYEIYTERCQVGRGGDALTDWCDAERELRTRDDDSRETADIGGESNRRTT